MIGIIDYGLGNIQAYINIYKRLNIPAKVIGNNGDLLEVNGIILPGVGSFDWAMAKLNQSGMREKIEELVLGRHIPILGVCVGMQMLVDGSEEGVSSGLGWVAGQVKRFNDAVLFPKYCLPHMGWNDVIPAHPSDSLFAGIENPQFYFLHSYYLSLESQADAIAYADYGQKFVTALRHGNIYGTQFHPEKSHQWGMKLLKNFASLSDA